MQKVDIWIDCDPGHDDMMAILLACYSDSINLLGISTTAGNKSLELTTTNALKTLYLIGVDNMPVYQGATESLVRGKMQSAPVFGDSGLDGAKLPDPTQKPEKENMYLHLYNLIMKHPRKVTLVATGPYTNFAILLRAFPEVKSKIEQFVVMGGAIACGNITPAAEFNVFCDPEAANVLLESGIPVMMVPLDVTHTVLYTPKVRESFCGSGSKFVNTLGDLLDFFMKETIRIRKLEGGPIHDPCTLAWLIKPDIFTVKPAKITVESRSAHCDGRTVVDFNAPPESFNAKIAVKANVPAFWEVVNEAIFRADKKSPLNK